MASLALVEIGVVAALLGLFFLVRRVVEAAKHNRAPVGSPAAAGAVDRGRPEKTANLGATAANRLITPTFVSDRADKLEVQLGDADNALFHVLMECCNAVVDADDRGSSTKSNAFLFAQRLKESGQSSMTNKEIADHAYQLAAELRVLGNPVMTDVGRVLAHLTDAEHLRDSWP